MIAHKQKVSPRPINKAHSKVCIGSTQAAFWFLQDCWHLSLPLD